MTDEYTGADLFVDALEQYGVSHVFGNPGTTELPVMRALGDSDLEYVLGLHEDVAVGMAAGFASTRRYHADQRDRAAESAARSPAGAESVNPVGVVNLHVAPGLAHGLGNLYGASVAGAPLVVTAGAHSLDFRHEEPILDGDLEAMTDQFTKWSAEVTDVDALPTMLRRAFRVATTPPTGPVFLALPLDVTMAATDADPEPLGPIQNPGAGDPSAIERAADLLVDADDPVLVVGDHVPRHGAWSETDPVDAAVRLAEAAGARVHAEILACEMDFPTDHDQWVSHVPPDEDVAAAVLNSDTVVLAGCSTNTTLVRHERELLTDDTTVVDLNDEPWQVGKNHPADAAVVGDLGLVLDAVADRVEDGVSDEERAERLERVEQFKTFAGQRMAAMGADEAPDDPRASKADLVDAMQTVAPDAYVVDESITSKYALLTRWDFDREAYLSN